MQHKIRLFFFLNKKDMHILNNRRVSKWLIWILQWTFPLKCLKYVIVCIFTIKEMSWFLSRVIKILLKMNKVWKRSHLCLARAISDIHRFAHTTSSFFSVVCVAWAAMCCASLWMCVSGSCCMFQLADHSSICSDCASSNPLPSIPFSLITWPLDLPIQWSGLGQCSTFSHARSHDLCAFGSAAASVVNVASLY